MPDRLGSKSVPPGGRSSLFARDVRRIGNLVAVLVLFGSVGCGTDESPPVSEGTPFAVASETPTATTDDDETAAERTGTDKAEAQIRETAADAKPAKLVGNEPESEPASVEQPVSAEQREAEATFRAMTADGVSQEDLDAATEKLLEIGAPAVPVFVAGLQAEQPLQREMAATMLAFFGATAADAKDALIAALQDESDFVRANAATALAQMAGQAEHVVPVFAEFLDGDDEHLRKMAAMNLSVLEVEAAKPLVGQLTELLSDGDRDVLLAIVELLGRIGPDAREAVDGIKALKTADDAELEAAVTAALTQIETDPEPP